MNSNYDEKEENQFYNNYLDQENIPRKFRPPSLSIITLTSENLRTPRTSIQDIEEEDESDIQKEEQHHKSEIQNDEIDNHINKIKRRASRKYSDADLKLRSIVYGKNDPDEDLQSDDDDKKSEGNPIEINQKRTQNEILITPNQMFLKGSNPVQNNYYPNKINPNIKPKNDNPIQTLVISNSDSKIHNGHQSKSILKSSPPSILSCNLNATDVTSIGECSIACSPTICAGVTEVVESDDSHCLISEQKANRMMMDRTVNMLSIIYAIFVVIVGALITIGDMSKESNDNDHLYNIVLTIIGIGFLAFVHYDIQRHKRFVLNWQEKQKELIESPLTGRMTAGNKECDSVSVTTAIIFNRMYQHLFSNHLNDDHQKRDSDVDQKTNKKLNSYRFLTGKHSGSFYLKIGMTLFCMGSIVHQGISFAFQIHFFAIDEPQCKNVISFIVYFFRCLSAFYQLYMAFKYSNLIINRHHYIVRFGLMHMVGSSLSFWFSTIIEEALHGYFEKIKTMHDGDALPNDATMKNAYLHYRHCSNKTLANFESIDAMPYFYPFTIEFNIILASVWYIIWTNVGNQDPASEWQNVREEINENHRTGTIDIVYRSNITINADCHASNLGIFGGLFSLLITTITIIIFFATIKLDEYKSIGISVYTAQLIFLTISCTLAVPMAYWRTRGLNVSKHLDSPQSSMDDFLLMAPLPFYYIHHILCIYSELITLSINSTLMAICYGLNLVQVTWQTMFIMDGTRRCSNDKKLRYKKPGKQLITFSIIINVTLWIMLTLEIKSVDKYHSMGNQFGKLNWMIIMDTCLPLMLFYRFHSSVCLSDMWKHCYEKDQH